MVGTLIRRPLPPVSDFIRTLLDDADATTALATLGVVSGTYTPTLFNTTNVDASTASITGYIRTGSNVYVFGMVQIDPTAAASTVTALGMSLPVASDFTVLSQLGGVAANAGGMVARITADPANNRAIFEFPSLTTTNAILAFSFGYQVV